jgi:hypothetical protein
MTKKKIVSILAVTVVLLSSSIIVYAETAQPAVTGYDLVDSGGHMDYNASTQYSGYLFSGANLWNDYLGTTVIREDSFGTINDCDIMDVTNSDVTWAGETGTPKTDLLPGYIYFNTYYMDQYSTTKAIFVVKHEFGHTLGCAENSCSDFNIMYPYVKSNINLSIHDKASVDLAKKSW